MPTRPEGPLSAQVRTELLRLGYRNQPASLFVAAAAGLGVCIFSIDGGLPLVGVWFAAMLVLSAGRLLVQAAFVRGGFMKPGLHEIPPVWRQRLVVGQVLSGLLWGVLAPLWLEDMHEDTRYATLIVLSALAGGATGVMAPLLGAGRIFIALVLVPPSLTMLAWGGDSAVLGALGFVFLGVMLFSHHNNHGTLRDSLRLRAENSSLVASLMQHTHEIEELNQGLEDKVRRRTQALERMADTDALTQLPNRRWLARELEQRLGQGEALAVMLIDLVGFKQINNRLGHEAGDEVLRAIAGRLGAELAPGHALARWGGDEFVLVAAGGVAGARQAFQEVRRAFATPVMARGEAQHVGVRAGIALEGRHGDVAASLLGAADMALTELKRGVRGHFLFFRGELAARQRRRMDLAFDIVQAGERAELRLVYQPIVSARHGEVVALEALCRWLHPRFGAVAPDEFIPLAEESSSIRALGLWVMRSACLEACRWGEHGPRVAVNVSGIQLRDPMFVRDVSALLLECALAPQRLEIEVTESVFEPANVRQMAQALGALSGMGMRIHVDDFGTGYSSLSRLHSLPIDAIKIDRSFVAALEDGASPVIEGAILIARRFGLETVAEGVETRAQAQALYRLGIDAFQGYFIARPSAEPQLHGRPPDWAAPAQLPQAERS